MSTPWLEMALRVPLDRFDLKVEAGFDAHVTGVFGPSGSGKTTLLETVAGLRRNARGRLVFKDTTWLEGGKSLPPEARGIGYVPQDLLLFPRRSVRKNLLAGAARAHAQGLDVEAVLDKVATMLELTPLMERSVDTLSGGERQRVSLGRALCSGPRLLLLDEPLSSLDGKLRHRILPFLQRVREEFEAPILIVSHQPLELQALCDEVLAIQEGKIVTRGKPVEVFTDPRVYGTASQEGFENVQWARVVERSETLCRLRLGESGDGPEVLVPPFHQAEDVAITIGLRANEILVALKSPQGLSARNCLEARVLKLEEVEGRILLVTLLDEAPYLPPIAVELTSLAVQELEIRSGMPIQLIFKTTAVNVYG